MLGREIDLTTHLIYVIIIVRIKRVLHA